MSWQRNQRWPSNSWEKDRRDKAQGKGRKQDPKKSQPREDPAGFSLPAYDKASPSAPSSGSGGDAADQMLKLLRDAASRDDAVAKQMEVLFPNQSEKEQLNLQQRHLNAVRKIRQKIQKKENVLSTREAQFQSLMEQIKEHVKKEKARHAQESADLEVEISSLKAELQKLKDTENAETMAVEADPSLEELLPGEEDHMEQERLKKELAAAKAEVQQAQNVAYAMQAQMNAFMEYQQMAAAAGIPSPLLPPEAPPGLYGPQSPQKPKPAILRDPKAPFGVVKTAMPRDSPYTRPEPRTTSPTTEEQEGMGGDGIMKHMD